MKSLAHDLRRKVMVFKLTLSSSGANKQLDDSLDNQTETLLSSVNIVPPAGGIFLGDLFEIRMFLTEYT